MNDPSPEMIEAFQAQVKIRSRLEAEQRFNNWLRNDPTGAQRSAAMWVHCLVNKMHVSWGEIETAFVKQTLERLRDEWGWTDGDIQLLETMVKALDWEEVETR